MKRGSDEKATSREAEIKKGLKEAFGKRHSRRKAGIIILLVILAVGAAAYLYFMTDFFFVKPYMPKPVFEGVVNTEHVSWVVNELGGYGLHNSISGEAPMIEVVVDDTRFTVTKSGGGVVSGFGAPSDPDMVIITTTENFGLLMEAGDVKEEATRLYNEGLISIELIKGVDILIQKGYKTIYDTVGG